MVAPVVDNSAAQQDRLFHCTGLTVPHKRSVMDRTMGKHTEGLDVPTPEDQEPAVARDVPMDKLDVILQEIRVSRSVKKRLKVEGVPFALLFPARLRITYNQKAHLFDTPHLVRDWLDLTFPHPGSQSQNEALLPRQKHQPLRAVAGVWTVILKEIIRVEDSLGPLEKKVVAQTQSAQRLQEARAEHTELLERLKKVDYAKYREHMHNEGDKAGALLARLIKDEPSPTPILHINTPQQTSVNTQMEMNEAFCDHYRTLYSAPLVLDPVHLGAFLSDITLPTLAYEAKQILGAQISQGEIQQAIKDMAHEKSPGSDGLPSEFYSLYSSKLAPQLERLYQASLANDCLPDTTKQAIVTSLLKPRKSPLDMLS
ncbi:hypothetical protein NDU88_002713 [Pleurodeles waltl]|uniref:Uncharacterized protein n=1 Tax=Pleurodeles waltl TaxID=8319 RepID=A0AAV7UDY5_PLEWA|nr:hypothetical protein NDU88_002713 [Pleurodeles waltl]